MAFQFHSAYDNGGATADRYRVVFEDDGPPIEDGETDREGYALLMSENQSPNGVCMTTDYAMQGPYPGETEIAYETLPASIRRRIERGDFE